METIFKWSIYIVACIGIYTVAQTIKSIFSDNKSFTKLKRKITSTRIYYSTYINDVIEFICQAVFGIILAYGGWNMTTDILHYTFGPSHAVVIPECK